MSDGNNPAQRPNPDSQAESGKHNDQKMRAVKWIISTTGGYKWLIAVITLIQAITASVGIVFALLMKGAIDSAVNKQSSDFTFFVFALGAAVALQLILGMVGRYVAEYASATFDNRFRQQVFGGLLNGDYANATCRHSGDVMNRLTSDINVVTSGALSLIPSLTSMAIRIVGVAIVMYALAPTLTLLFLAAGVLMVLLSLPLRGWLKRLHRGVQEAEGRVRSFLQECLENVLVIKVFGCVPRVLGINRDNMLEHKRSRIRRVNASILAGTGLSMALQCGYFAGFIWCGAGILQGTVSYGTLVALMQLISQIQGPIASLGGIFPQLATISASAERLMELLPDRGRTPLHLDSRNNIVDANDADGVSTRPDWREISEQTNDSVQSIYSEHVLFGYGRRPVLNDFSMSITAGEIVAIVGPSGTGKSTLFKLLLGVYAPQSGFIGVRLGSGDSIASADMPNGLLAYVPQGNFLMSGTIEDAVTFAESDSLIDDEQLEWACNTACCSEFIESLPEGYDTELAERGAGLSEGQMQRLAIARALYTGAPVVLLDESTSALDAQTEERLLDSLRSLNDRTVLIATHRPEVIESCDRVIRIPTIESEGMGI
jgi:ATP-binding cassette subfamily B protein